MRVKSKRGGKLKLKVLWEKEYRRVTECSIKKFLRVLEDLGDIKAFSGSRILGIFNVFNTTDTTKNIDTKTEDTSDTSFYLAPIYINFVSKQTIQTLNNKYMNRRDATDVISFRYDNKRILGEVYISPYVVYRNAKRYGQTFCRELYRVIIHGVLHVLGFVHSSKMFALQEKILDNALEILNKKNIDNL